MEPPLVFQVRVFKPFFFSFSSPPNYHIPLSAAQAHTEIHCVLNLRKIPYPSTDSLHGWMVGVFLMITKPKMGCCSSSGPAGLLYSFAYLFLLNISSSNIYSYQLLKHSPNPTSGACNKAYRSAESRWKDIVYFTLLVDRLPKWVIHLGFHRSLCGRVSMMSWHLICLRSLSVIQC